MARSAPCVPTRTRSAGRRTGALPFSSSRTDRRAHAGIAAATRRWKVLVLPAGADARKKEADDQAVQLYVVWQRLPRVLNSRIIGYIWDSSATAGGITT